MPYKAARLVLVLLLAVGLNAEQSQKREIDAASGLIVDQDQAWEHVRDHCTSCHSSQTFTQQKLSKKKWLDVIRRMQKEEGLWDLGEYEDKIVTYLAAYYSENSNTERPRSKRKPLVQIPKRTNSN